MTEQPGAADEIMDGVYRALCRHGYADLTMQDIADECSKSKSLLHYHYDTKEDLLVRFLDRVISDFECRVERSVGSPPVDRLVAFVGWFVFEPAETDRESFHIALLEMRSQGPFNDRIREQLLRSDRLLRGTAAEILAAGIDADVFRDVDVEETAALLVATLDGARTRQITLGSGLGGGSDGESNDEAGSAPATDGAYTRTVAEATLRRIVEPLLAEDVTLPSLEEAIEELTARTGENPTGDSFPEGLTIERPPAEAGDRNGNGTGSGGETTGSNGKKIGSSDEELE
ncbi:TetR family transcriptional regulator [Halorubrum sp. CBA1125]|uniref:TetR family transcriptional regulator C-terminal domain-containing protein n=1 Tax=Halorubrum sp. CBA1125 TaxID=2668072 RepID=UPI0012E7615B|nr:TetR/AcrR family transcriptional regulator [Halorubrum sp. CBA1125]MUW15165.1 TetR family transcriptional regulator [Halorubrum sp. CBA1125]